MPKLREKVKIATICHKVSDKTSFRKHLYHKIHIFGLVLIYVHMVCPETRLNLFLIWIGDVCFALF